MALTPIQILMLGLAGYGGYKQGKQQRNEKQRDQQQEAEKLRRVYAQQELENKIKLAEESRRQGAYDIGLEDREAGKRWAWPLGAIAPGGTQQDIVQRVVGWA